MGIQARVMPKIRKIELVIISPGAFLSDGVCVAIANLNQAAKIASRASGHPTATTRVMSSGNREKKNN